MTMETRFPVWRLQTEDESDGSNSSSSQDNMALDQKEISQAAAAGEDGGDQIETEGEPWWSVLQ